MKKKLLSLIMAIAMIASLAIPAFATGSAIQTTSAATDGVYSATTTIGGKTRVAVVSVTLPASTAVNKVILNPYELKLYNSAGAGSSVSAQQVGSADSALGSATGAISPQVITVPMEIKSNSDVPLMVGVKAKATVAGEAKLSATHVDQSLVGTDKNVFVYLDMVRAKDGAQVTDWTATEAPKWHDDPSKVNTTAFAQVIPTASGEQKDKLFVIPASDGSSANATYAYFKIMGSTAPDPKKDWAATDTVSVELAFTFAPAKVYPIQAHKTGSTSPETTLYTVAAGDNSFSATVGGKDNVTCHGSAAAGMPVVVKAKSGNVFTDITIIKPTNTANGVKEDDETRAATAVKVTDDTYYFIMPADKDGVVIRASTEAAS